MRQEPVALTALAQDVGIHKASIHHHFPTKAALSMALMWRYYCALEASCIEIDANNSTGGARISALVNLYLNALDGGKSLCLCVSFSISRESLPADVIAQISRFRAMMLGWIAKTFERGRRDDSIKDVGDPALEATALLSLLEGAQLAARAEENPTLFKNAMRLLMTRVEK